MGKPITISSFTGYFYCRSAMCSTHCTCDNTSVSLSVGINRLKGEIDSFGYAISYALSMANCDREGVILGKKPFIKWGEDLLDLSEVCERACYIDVLYPSFDEGQTALSLLETAQKKNKTNYNTKQIIERFCLSQDRLERPLFQCGNEAIRCMVAIGLLEGKDLFCFPWYSKTKFDFYKTTLDFVLKELEKDQKIVLVPMSEEAEQF